MLSRAARFLCACLACLPPFAASGQRRFRKVAEEVGVEFHHLASKGPQKPFLETMGAGVAMLDYDGDGLLDLYFVNGADLSQAAESQRMPKTEQRYWNRLYRNLGGWRFDDVIETAGVAGRGYGTGTAVADYDADGDRDLFVTNFGRDILFRNEENGTFVDVSPAAGIDRSGWSSGAVFFDFDNDGDPDVFVASYLDWDFGRSRPCGEFLPRRRSYCHPRSFVAVRHTL